MTLYELKQRMSQSELQVWEAYVDENGPLQASLRVEAAVARAVSPFIRHAKPRDFMPWPKEPEPEATQESLFLLFKNLATETKRKH